MKKVIIAVVCICLLGGTLYFAFLQNPNPKEIIGIIGAMDNEVDTLKKAADIKNSTKIADMDFMEGKIGDKKVVIVKCGMGKVNAGICAHTLIDDFGCTKIINTGVAGSLDNRIDIGDIVVSTEAVQHDFDVSPIGYKKGEIPYTGLVSFKADKELRAEAVKAVEKSASDVKAFEGRVCTGDQFIASDEQRDTITSKFGGLCCEMEGGAIAQVCHLNKTPFVIIRAISDKADSSEEVEYAVFEPEAARHCANITLYMLKDM